LVLGILVERMEVENLRDPRVSQRLATVVADSKNEVAEIQNMEQNGMLQKRND